jgi:phosphoglycolate phosphatase
MKYRAVIFDLDGTLLDTLEDIADASNMVLKQNGLSTYTVARYRQFVGRGMKNLVRSILPPIMKTDEHINKFLFQIGDEYVHRLTNKTHPYPGIQELLGMVEDKGIKKSILSNKPEQMVRYSAEHYFPHIGFSFVMGSNERFALKPAPESALFIADGMGVSPAEVVFLGDSAIDMETAKNAGMYALGAGWGFRCREELIEAGAERVISRPEEVGAFI